MYALETKKTTFVNNSPPPECMAVYDSIDTSLELSLNTIVQSQLCSKNGKEMQQFQQYVANFSTLILYASNNKCATKKAIREKRLKRDGGKLCSKVYMLSRHQSLRSQLYLAFTNSCIVNNQYVDFFFRLGLVFIHSNNRF